MEPISYLLIAAVEPALCCSTLSFSRTFTRKTAARVSSADFGRWHRQKVRMRTENDCWRKTQQREEYLLAHQQTGSIAAICTVGLLSDQHDNSEF